MAENIRIYTFKKINYVYYQLFKNFVISVKLFKNFVIFKASNSDALVKLFTISGHVITWTREHFLRTGPSSFVSPLTMTDPSWERTHRVPHNQRGGRLQNASPTRLHYSCPSPKPWCYRPTPPSPALETLSPG